MGSGLGGGGSLVVSLSFGVGRVGCGLGRTLVLPLRLGRRLGRGISRLGLGPWLSCCCLLKRVGFARREPQVNA